MLIFISNQGGKERLPIGHKIRRPRELPAKPTGYLAAPLLENTWELKEKGIPHSSIWGDRDNDHE